VAEILFCEDRVTRATWGADTPFGQLGAGLVRVLTENSRGILTVTAVDPAGEENQGIGRRTARVRFPRSGRLLRHADFERVYKQGRRHFSASMTVFYWQRPRPSAHVTTAKDISGFRVGFTVGRALGGAVQRNRMKRRLREAVRLARTAMGPDVDVVINPKKSILTADFATVVTEVSRAFAVIDQKLGKESTTGEKSRETEGGSRKPN
jgi:ribonuclease P protein component